MDLFTIFMTSLITENVILTKFLGICSFLGSSNKEKNAIGMGISVTFVVLISTIITYLINKFILIPTKAINKLFSLVNLLILANIFLRLFSLTTSQPSSFLSDLK